MSGLVRPPAAGVLHAALAILLGGLLVRAFASFAPGSAHMGLFDADMAIPVLMANGSSGHRLFDAYYFGQDRLGAWPQLLARLARGVLGFDWTVARLSQAQVSAALLAGLPLVLRGRRVGWVAAAACALAAVTQPAVSRSFLSLGQPYAWQALALCGAWALLHSLLSRPERPGGRLAGLGALAFLAVWMSPTSGPLLVALLGVEWVARRGPEPWGERLWRALPLAVLVGVAMAGERTLRWRYHRTMRRVFGNDFRTEVGLDTGHLLDNVRALAEVWAREGWWPALVLAGVGVGAFLVLRPRRQVPEGWEALTLAVGAVGVAGANLALCAAVSHVRLNLYHERYLTLSHLFLAMAAALVGLAGAQALLARARASEGGAWLLAPVLLGAAHLGLPAPAPLAEQRGLEETARLLQPERGTRVLLGDYWQTYPYAALARPGSLVAMPVEWSYHRTPFDRERLGEVDEVVLNHAELDAFGPPGAPHALIGQYGVLLRLVRTASPREGFSLYTRADREALPATPVPSPPEWNLCEASARATVRFESPGPVRVLVRARGVREGAPVPRAVLAGRELPVEVLPDFYQVRVAGPVRGTPLELGASVGRSGDAPGCRAQDVFVLPERLAR